MEGYLSHVRLLALCVCLSLYCLHGSVLFGPAFALTCFALIFYLLFCRLHIHTLLPPLPLSGFFRLTGV